MPELVFPEIVIRNVLEGSLARLLANDAILSLAVSELSQAERDTIRTMLQMRPGKVRLGWSREPFDDWVITVALASTKKTATLGEVVSGLKDVVVGMAMLGGAVSAEVGQGLPGVVRPAGAAERGLLRIGDEIAAYHDQAGTVVLVSRGLPDVEGGATAPAAHVSGEVASFFGRAHDLGWAEEDHLRLDVVSTSALFAIILGRLLPAWFALDWRYFEERGVSLEEATESDLAPRPFFVPDEGYARTLMVKCTTKVALPESIVPITDVTTEVVPEVPLLVEVPSA